MIKDSSLVVDFYVHPGYLVIDQVLDQIGKNFVSDWDPNCVKTSKVVRETGRISRIEIAYLTPLQEAIIREKLGSYKSINKKYTKATSNLLKKKHFAHHDGTTAEDLFRELESPERDLIGMDILRVMDEMANSKLSSSTQMFYNVAFLPKDSRILVENRFSEASDFEVGFNILDFAVKNLGYEDIKINLKNLLDLTKVRNCLRDALVEGTLCSYIEKDGNYCSIPASVWADEQEWCRLLLEGFKAEIVWQTITRRFGELKLEDFLTEDIKNNVDNDPMVGKEKKIISQGRVFFRKSEVKEFLENSGQVLPYIEDTVNKGTWEKLLNPKKPWLKLLNELALSLPEEVIETKTKKELMRDIRQKANLSGLIPTDIKVELLATFLRSPEQEKGKARYTKDKEEKAIG
jgi:hypothetical protein